MEKIESRFQVIPPFRMVGNLYFVGSYEESSHVIVTEEGLILIDVGSEENISHVLSGLKTLGLDVADIRYILLSHWHSEHTEGVPALRKLTGAKVLIGEADAKELSFPVDGVLRDGDTVTLGSTAVLCVASPGHTAGTMSFFFDVTEGGKALRCGMFGGASPNRLKKEFLDRNSLSYALRGDFFRTLTRLEQEHVDVLVGNHSRQDRTRENREILMRGEKNPFINAALWGEFLADLRKKMWEVIETESREGFVVYAHRGASEYCPENTMLSFYTGVYMGANGIETDVHRTRDGVLVLFHDDTVERMMGKPGSIGDYTFAELSDFVMEKHGRRDYIVTLDAFLAAFGRMDLTLAIELKDKEVEADVAAAIRKYGVEKKTVVTSFYLPYLKNMHRIAPELKLGFLARHEKITEELLTDMQAHGIDEICPYSKDVTPENTRLWHEMGFRVRAWGVGDEERMRQVYDNGADGTTVNFPDKLLEYIASKKE